MTCYLNSLIQTLYMTPEFRNALYRWRFEGTAEEQEKSIPFQLQSLFIQLQTTEKASIGTTNLTRSFGWDSSEAWQQHDIQELCRIMFDALEHNFKRTEQADLISRRYEGKMVDCVTWIKDKILHGYYMTGLEDRLLVERLLNTCLVPYQLPVEVRMKKLYYLYATIDENATKSFIELQKSQATVRKAVSDLTEIYSQRLTPEARDKEITSRVAQLSKYLPDPIKAAEFIHKFAMNLVHDENMLRLLETIVSPEVSCKDCADTGSQLLKKLGCIPAHVFNSCTYINNQIGARHETYTRVTAK
jgi:hypothetical protein